MPHGDSTTFIRLRSGRKFWPLDPRAEDIDVCDIAYGLAGQFRYAGHSRLTVAQHSVVGSMHIAGVKNKLAFLFHDCAEGLGLGDVPRPLKRSGHYRFYLAAEDRILVEAAKKFGFIFPLSAAVKQMDGAMCVTEKKEMVAMLGEMAVLPKAAPLNFTPDEQRVWEPEEAEERFLRRYSELTGEVVADLDWFGAKSALSVLLPPTKLAARIADTALHLPDPSRPPNSFTQAEYARDNAVSIHTATRSIKKMYEAGRVKPVKFKTRRSDGQVTMVAGWELVEPAAGELEQFSSDRKTR